MTVSTDRETEILTKLHDAVVGMNKKAATEASNEALAAGISAYKAIMDGLTAGMATVGRLFDEGEYFVPETLMCAEALYAGLDILRPHINQEELGSGAKGHIVIGVVQGDVHDIAKNLVKIMFEVAGFTVHDLGRDVPLDKFAETQMNFNAEIVALSTMMTTTMPAMKRAIALIKERNPNVKIMIGGAPISQKAVDEFGADTTARNANSALGEAIKLVAALRGLDSK